MASSLAPQRLGRALIVALLLALLASPVGLTACGGSSGTAEEQATEEQDNCYGDDLPVVND